MPTHFSFSLAYEKLQNWQSRFPSLQDERIFKDLNLLYLSASEKFLDHRNATHLARLTLSIHFVQKSLQRSFALSSHTRHLEIKWIPADLSFPFSSKAVLGCLVGFNVINRYELFDEENVRLVIKKNYPWSKIVKDSFYSHVLTNKNLKIMYFEIEKEDASFFSLAERHAFASNLKSQIRGSFQKLAPTVFMRRNEEEVYKTILTLSREIHSVGDMPQVWISFEQRIEDEIVFLVILVYVSSNSDPILPEPFTSSGDYTLVSERQVNVKRMEEHFIRAHVLRLHLKRTLPFLRSDSSLNFYACRQKAVSIMTSAIGEFRDYNGGALITQQELLENFKRSFPLLAAKDPELMETFFYGLTPLEKQALLPDVTLATLFQYFLNHQSRKLPTNQPFIFEFFRNEHETYMTVQGVDKSWKELILETLERREFRKCDLAYTAVTSSDSFFFQAVFSHQKDGEILIQEIEKQLEERCKAVKRKRSLRIGGEYALVSLDPRIGGDLVSSQTLKLLFEGLMRIGKGGQLENGIAESVSVSDDFKQYIFKLRPARWNDGTFVTAHDFEYSWKKILSPAFETTSACLFYPIMCAKEAKEGKVSLDRVGIAALDERTLRVDLAHPTPYFLELTAQSICYPVHRGMDLKSPQWPYQVGHSYPCNGPFQLAINDHNHQTYRLVRNPAYWDANAVILDEIFLTQMNPHQAYRAFQNGELDWIGNPYGGWHPFYVPQQDERIISIPNASTYWLELNTLDPVLRHPKVRQALARVVDRSQLISDAYLSLTPAYSVLSENAYYSPQASFPQQDVEVALQLLQEGLHDLGLSKAEQVSLQLTFHPGGFQERIALLLTKQFQDLLNIECRLYPLSWDLLFSKLAKNEFQLSLTGWIPRTSDPITTLNHFQKKLDFTNWDDPLFHQWLSLSDQEINHSQRLIYLMLAEERLCQEVPVIPLFHLTYQALVRRGFQLTHFYSTDLASIDNQETCGIKNG